MTQQMNHQPLTVYDWVVCLKVSEIKNELLARSQMTTGLKGVLLARLNEV
jgi:hypothetical protein